MFKLANDTAIGEYLRTAILKKYESIRKFCRAYLELKDGQTDDEEIRKLLNRFSQILKGTKRIQTDDLPFVTELLDVSCEEVLSAGKTHVPVSSHTTNYDIAFSKDRETWEKYMKREDKLFLNCDEYCKSVIDYALEFKNYAFIKYLLDEHFIWFVNLSDWKGFGFTFGAGTSVKRREVGYIDTHTPIEIQSQDRLRTQTIALAIENNDIDILDALLAREIPELHSVNFFYSRAEAPMEKNDDLLRAVALSDNEAIINYFSDEFPVKNLKYTNRFVFPHLGELIDLMLENGRYRNAEICIRKAIRHNKSVLNGLNTLIKEAYEFNRSHLGFSPDGMDEYLKKQTMYDLCYDEMHNLVKYFYCPEMHKYVGLVSNYIRVTSDKSNALIKELVTELNESCDAILSLKGDAE
ncbi:MAG: hypothetical protein ILO53_00270 [Clostridia bacterium]|nr:hypothetical protein [Clostridia bacterium]